MCCLKYYTPHFTTYLSGYTSTKGCTGTLLPIHIMLASAPFIRFSESPAELAITSCVAVSPPIKFALRSELEGLWHGDLMLEIYDFARY